LATDGAAEQAPKRISPPLWAGWTGFILALVLIGVSVGLYLRFVPGDINSLQLQLAGLPRRAFTSPAVVHAKDTHLVLAHAAAVRKAAQLQAAARVFRRALWWQLAALSAGTAGLLTACYLGRKVFWTQRLQWWAMVGMVASAAALVLNAVADGLQLVPHHDLGGSGLASAASGLSLAKFSAAGVAAVIGMLALCTTIGRLIRHRATKKHWERIEEEALARDARDLVIPPPLIEAAAAGPGIASADPVFNQSWWDSLSRGAGTRWAQGYASPSPRLPGRTGICVSGGGIRSASVALGALQALRAAGDLGAAEYLVSVSGGGFTVAGMQLALMPADPGPAVADPAGQQHPGTGATPGDVFDPGSAEEDHLRRHSSYIADGLRQWLAALAVLFRGVLSSLVVIGLTITTLGLALGGFYGYVPIVNGGNLTALRPAFLLHGHPSAPGFPAIPLGVKLAIGCSAALTLLVYLILQIPVPESGRARQIRRTAGALLAVTALLAAAGVALPALLWASSWVTWRLGFSARTTVSVSSLSVVLIYLGAVATVLWRKRTTIAKSADAVSGLSKSGPVNQILPNSMIQMIIMWISLGFLILVSLLLGGWVATSGLVDSWWALLPVGALAFLSVIIDQSAFSLHPFYRRRLATAFAVRRVRQHGADVAEPYNYDDDTLLSTYARRWKGFPGVTFAATANITGQDRTPPGRPAVPYMLAHDYVGGPATGWVRTDFLEQLAGPLLRRDLTVEAAMAISGAAFAAAMGSQTRFYEVFLTIANARLGAWLPNPYFVALKLQHPDEWIIPGLPNRRRPSYFAREIFGIHPSTSRLLLCTDGGHYDNLGLVELLRRRCERIYCIDASASEPPLDDPLASAITLAREELGVGIDLDAALELVPGGWDQLAPSTSFTDLNSRLSMSAVTTGGITYPAAGGHEAATGELVFAQVVLTPDMPYQLLEFPQDDAGFPRDSTGDQFFSASQFDAYQQLGYYIGQAAAQRQVPVAPGA
jgi:hypothetical protein